MPFIQVILAVLLSTTVLHGQAPAPTATGQLAVSFLYMPPTEVEPTYHTCMWLEDKNGKLVRTLFVSNELAANEYKVGDACPNWLKQASWAKAPKSLVDAVSGPTPNVGSGAMAFDLSTLGIPAGSYVFCFQVHIEKKYNVQFRGTFNAGQSAQDVKMDVLYSAGKPPGDENIVKDVHVQYVPAAVK